MENTPQSRNWCGVSGDGDGGGGSGRQSLTFAFSKTLARRK